MGSHIEERYFRKLAGKKKKEKLLEAKKYGRLKNLWVDECEDGQIKTKSYNTQISKKYHKNQANRAMRRVPVDEVPTGKEYDLDWELY